MILARRFIADRRRSLVGWSLGAAFVVLLSVAFYPAIRSQPSLDDAMANLPEGVKAAIGISEGVSLSSPAGYLQGRMFSTTLPILLLILAISLGARAIGTYEEEGHLELLLANPITRRRVALGRGAGAVAVLLVVTLVTTVLLFVLGPPFGALEGLPSTWVLAACAGCGTLAVLHLAVAFAVGCATGRRGPALGVSTAIAVAGYLLHGLLAAAKAPDAVRDLSPWFWYLRTNMLVDGVDPVALFAPVVVAALLGVVGVVLLERRDLR